MTRSSQKKSKSRNVVSLLLRSHAKGLKEKIETVVSPPSLRNSIKEKVETIVSPSSFQNSIKEKVETVVSPLSLQNSKRSLKVRENVDAVLRNYQIIAVILSHRIHETKFFFWI